MANMSPQLEVIRLKIALLVTLGAMAMKQGPCHSAQAHVLLELQAQLEAALAKVKAEHPATRRPAWGAEGRPAWGVPVARGSGGRRSRRMRRILQLQSAHGAGDAAGSSGADDCSVGDGNPSWLRGEAVGPIKL